MNLEVLECQPMHHSIGVDWLIKDSHKRPKRTRERTDTEHDDGSPRGNNIRLHGWSRRMWDRGSNLPRSPSSSMFEETSQHKRLDTVRGSGCYTYILITLKFMVQHITYMLCSLLKIFSDSQSTVGILTLNWKDTS